MIIQEIESHKHQCPMKFSSGPGRVCSGKECMAWRWAHEPNPDYVAPNPLLYRTENPATFSNPFRHSTTHGYCGMGGNV